MAEKDKKPEDRKNSLAVVSPAIVGKLPRVGKNISFSIISTIYRARAKGWQAIEIKKKKEKISLMIES